MMLNTAPWKAELDRHICDLEEISAISFEEESAETDFALERALFYSAMIVRLLIDDGEVTDKIKGINLRVGVIPASPRAGKDTSPIIRRFINERLYDFDNEQQISVSGRKIANQIIHSFVIVSFQFSESECPTGFYVSSDHASADELYHVQLCDWINFLKIARDDEVVRTEYWRDPETGKWKITRS